MKGRARIIVCLKTCSLCSNESERREFVENRAPEFPRWCCTTSSVAPSRFLFLSLGNKRVLLFRHLKKIRASRPLVPRGIPRTRFKLAMPLANQHLAGSGYSSPWIDGRYLGSRKRVPRIIDGDLAVHRPWISELQSGFPTSINFPFTSS